MGYRTWVHQRRDFYRGDGAYFTAGTPFELADGVAPPVGSVEVTDADRAAEKADGFAPTGTGTGSYVKPRGSR